MTLIEANGNRVIFHLILFPALFCAAAFFAIRGRYLLAANQATDNIVVLRVDAETGQLHETGHSVSVPSPVCVVMMCPRD